MPDAELLVEVVKRGLVLYRDILVKLCASGAFCGLEDGVFLVFRHGLIVLIGRLPLLLVQRLSLSDDGAVGWSVLNPLEVLVA